MKLPMFTCYSLSERFQITIGSGKLLLLRHTASCSVLLYKVGDFFAEVWLDSQDSQVVMVHGFKNLKLLEPYLELIDISRLAGKE